MEGRILALDVGTKRIGIAITDPLQIIAQTLKTIPRNPEQKSIEEIKTICKEYNVSTIIVGHPINMDGSRGPQAKDAELYAELIKENTGIDVILEDERLSSKDAERILIEQNKKPSRNKALIDMAAAAIILQQFLDRRR